MGLEKSDEGIKNLQNNAEKCRKKEADKLIKVLYFFGLFMVAFACAALFLAYSRHRAPDFRSYNMMNQNAGQPDRSMRSKFGSEYATMRTSCSML
ncbi:unnamed protein product [Oikopleura dioica]|uniref:Uncharacterized protein n=1 Tax=Oikopleura dioica TaxID=34765 RepID=E4YAH8_OIKDI|nr:unnamed protein product [Oikopleura dioica]